MSSLSFFPSFYCYCRYSIWWRRYCCYQFRLLKKRVGESAEFTSSWKKTVDRHLSIEMSTTESLTSWYFHSQMAFFLFTKSFILFWILTGRWREWRDNIEEWRHFRFWELSFHVNWWEKSINRGRILSFRCVRDKHRHMAHSVSLRTYSLP